MNSTLRLCIIGAIFTSFSMGLPACVTTRAQLNEQNGVSEGNAEEAGYQKVKRTVSVKSEEIAAPTPAPAPVAQAPVTQAPTTPAPLGVAPLPEHHLGPVPPTAPVAPVAAVPATSSTPSHPAAAAAAMSGGSYGEEEMRSELARLSGQVEEMEKNNGR